MSSPDASVPLSGAPPARRAGPRLSFAALAAGVAALLGLIVVAGWVFDVPALRSAIPGAVEMKINTAVGLLATSAAVLMLSLRPADRRHHLPGALGLFIALLGTVTLCEFAFGWDAGIDELLARDTGAAFKHAKGRMSPYTAVALVALGSAILCLARHTGLALARGAGGLAAAIGIVSIIGYLWNVNEIDADRVVTPVAVNAAFALVLLGAAVFALALPALPAAQRRARSRLETLVLGGFVPTVATVLIGGGFIYEAGASYARATERVAHTQEVRALLGRLYGSIVDAEFARRNHVLTGDAAFERDFASQTEEVRRNATSLRKLIADNPAQAALQQRLTGLLEARIRALEETGRILNAQGQTAARASLLTNARDGLVSQIRELSARMDSAETVLLSARTQQAHEQQRTTLVALLVTLLVLTGMFVLLIRGIKREMRARAIAEAELQRLNASLEQRVAERTGELSFQQGFLRRVIDLNPSFIFAKDREGRFVLANQALADALGVSVDALVGTPEQASSPNHDEARRFAAADLQVIESGQDLVIDAEKFTNARNEARLLSTVKRPILAPDGVSTIVLGVSTDITERKAAEEAVRRLAGELEERVEARTVALHQSNMELEQARLNSEAASRAKSAFLANMSHEIRTPMNAIIGLTHLMLRDARDASQRDRLTKVGEAAKHLLQVINDILDMSKIEAGKLTLNDAEFSMDALMSGATEMVAPVAREKELEVILDTDHLPARLVGDRMRLSQVLINLLSNAVKFTESGWVRLRGEAVGEHGRRLLIRFEVQDTGPGIAEDRQAGLFMAFEQADNSTSRQHGGTGLGLALSRQLARAMGGEAGVISAPGAGSTFWFTAWLTRAIEDATPLPVPINLRGRRALVVDDLPEALHVLSERLKVLGIEVDALPSGTAAMAKVEADRAAGRSHDLMFIDWRMQPLDGFDTLAGLRHLLGEAAPPSVLVTAFDDPAIAQSALGAGFDTVMLKPVTASALQDTLANLLRWRAPAAPPEPATTPGLEVKLRTQHGGQRVLLAEDNPVNREVAEELLRSAGLVVETAWDGARAVEMAVSQPYDLVLMDVQMPVMDGLEASRAIRERMGHTIPIIATTANAFTEDRQACLAAGMNDHVPKPLDPAVLYAAMLHWLPRREPLDAPAWATDTGAQPAAPKPMDLRDRLAKLEGLDVDLALRNVAGQLPALTRVLRRFVSTYRRGLPELLESDEDEHSLVLRWRTACHSMRGSLGAIGATQLLQDVKALEQDLAELAPRARMSAKARQLHEGVLALVARLELELAG